MAELEKVIKGLECCTKLGCHHGCEYKSNGYSPMTCFQELEKDALELLKDQAKRIETLENVNAIDLNPKWPYVFNNYRKVVLCKNCKWYYANGGNCEQVLADWFCADGELKG